MRTSKLFTFLFSAFFWIFAFSFMFLLAIGTMLGCVFTHYRNIHSRIPAPGFAWIIRVVTLGQFRMVFEEGFDSKRLSVFCMNHTNLLDGHTASATIPQAFCGLMNAWQRHIPFYGWLMVLSRGILIDKKKGNVLRSITEAAKQRMRENMSILVFPEAHRTLDGKVQRFRKGVFFMARDAGYPVVPMAVRGMFAVNHKGSYAFHPGPVTIFVGRQRETKGLTDSQIETLSDDLHRFMVERVEGKSEFSKAVNG
jgi:1-acyl-sn-glycerol-3-phosphate acyltransferase